MKRCMPLMKRMLNSDVAIKFIPFKLVNIIGLLTKGIKNADEYK